MAKGHAMETGKQMSRAGGEPKMCCLSIKMRATRAIYFENCLEAHRSKYCAFL